MRIYNIYSSANFFFELFSFLFLQIMILHNILIKFKFLQRTQKTLLADHLYKLESTQSIQFYILNSLHLSQSLFFYSDLLKRLGFFSSSFNSLNICFCLFLVISFKLFLYFLYFCKLEVTYEHQCNIQRVLTHLSQNWKKNKEKTIEDLPDIIEISKQLRNHMFFLSIQRIFSTWL